MVSRDESRVIALRKIILEHIYMRLKVNSNRFEISNHFEKSFRLYDDFAATTFQTVVRFYCTCTNDIGAIIRENVKSNLSSGCIVYSAE